MSGGQRQGVNLSLLNYGLHCKALRIKHNQVGPIARCQTPENVIYPNGTGGIKRGHAERLG